jgi:large subunit ribosomal protein L25
MPEIPLMAQAGRPTGSRAARRLRRAGKIPAVLYGHGVESQAIAVEGRELRAALTTEAGLNALLSVRVDGSTHLAMARELQRDPVRGAVRHIDFVIVRRDEVVTVDVPVTLTGEATLVHQGDGVVDQQLHALSVKATPARIPTHLEVDIGRLAIGDTIRVQNLSLPEGVATDVDAETAVVVGQPPQVSAADLVTEAEAEAAAAAAEAAEAAPEEEGAAPAAPPGAPAEGGAGGGGDDGEGSGG